MILIGIGLWYAVGFLAFCMWGLKSQKQLTVKDLCYALFAGCFGLITVALVVMGLYGDKVLIKKG